MTWSNPNTDCANTPKSCFTSAHYQLQMAHSVFGKGGVSGRARKTKQKYHRLY